MVQKSDGWRRWMYVKVKKKSIREKRTPNSKKIKTSNKSKKTYQNTAA